MRKRAKCKVCNSILEVTLYDMTFCKCGEVSIDMLSGEFHANVQDDINNLILVDDEGNEIIPKIATNSLIDSEIPYHNSKQSLIYALEQMSKNIYSLPSEARSSPITHSDFGELITLLSSIFRAS